MNDVTAFILVLDGGDRLPHCLESAAFTDDMFYALSRRPDEAERRLGLGW